MQAADLWKNLSIPQTASPMGGVSYLTKRLKITYMLGVQARLGSFDGGHNLQYDRYAW